MKREGRPRALPIATERALIQALLDKELLAIKFKTICDKRPDIFGSPGSDLHRRVGKRRDYLKDNHVALKSAVHDFFPGTNLEDGELASLVVATPVKSETLLSPSFSSPPVAPRLFSSPRPSRKMSHIRDDDDDDDTTEDGVDTASFPLFIEKPWRNPFGMMVVKGTEVEEDNTVVDKLTILKPIFDIKDFDGNMYKGRLCSDGGGIIATEPSIPGYLWQNPKEIQLLVDEADRVDKVCQPSFRTYKIIRTDMKKNVKTQTKEVVYRFPRGVTCNNEFFNKANRRSSQLDLDTEIYLKPDELGEDEDTGESIKVFLPFIVWRVAIDGAGKQTADEDEDVNALGKAFARAGIKKRGTPNPNAMSG